MTVEEMLTILRKPNGMPPDSNTKARELHDQLERFSFGTPIKNPPHDSGDLSAIQSAKMVDGTVELS